MRRRFGGAGRSEGGILPRNRKKLLQKNGVMFQRCIKRQSSQKILLKWFKINFPMRFSYVNPKNVPSIEFQQKAQSFSAGFFISYRFLKDSQEAMTFPQSLFKLASENQKLSQNLCKFSKNCRFSLIFRLGFWQICLLGGLSPRAPYKCFLIFLNFVDFEKISRTFSLKIIRKFLPKNLIF